MGDLNVLTTIIMGTCVSVQGTFVKNLENGFVVVRVGDQTYAGRPVATMAA